VNTTGQVVETGRRRRRTHSAHAKAEAMGACQQAAVSIAAVALARGLNAAMLHRWVKQAERSGRPIAIRDTAASVAIASEEAFIRVPLPSQSAAGAIRIEVRRRGGTGLSAPAASNNAPSRQQCGRDDLGAKRSAHATRLRLRAGAVLAVDNMRRTDARLMSRRAAIFRLLTPLANNARNSAVFCGTVGGRPCGRTSLRAWAIPAFTRSRKRSRSNSARLPACRRAPVRRALS
jgi:transposase